MKQYQDLLRIDIAETNQDLTNVLWWWLSLIEGQRQFWTRNPPGSQSIAGAPVFKAQNRRNIGKTARKISGPVVVCAVHRVMMTECRVFANYFPTTLIINIFVPLTENDRWHRWPSYNCRNCQMQPSYMLHANKGSITYLIWIDIQYPRYIAW